MNIKSEWIQSNSNYILKLLKNTGFEYDNLYKINYQLLADEIYDSIYIHLSNHLSNNELLDNSTINAIESIIEDFAEILSYDQNKYKKLYNLYESFLTSEF
jgi:hypothetical protein